MKTATLNRGFITETTDTNGVRVSGQGAGLGFGGIVLIAILSLMISIPLGGAISVFVLGQEGSIVTLIIVLLVSTAIVRGVDKLKRPSFCFELTADGIVKNGELYKHQEIGEVFIDNRHYKGQELSSGNFARPVYPAGVGAISNDTIIVSNAVGSAVILGSAAIGAKINYRVNFRHGRRTIRLATSLTSNTASELFDFITDDCAA